MSSNMWVLDKDLCRCCHAEGSFCNLSQPYTESGRDEIYSEIIKDCFNIEMRPAQGQLDHLTHKICKACILRLKDAYHFKRQVLDCEAKFMEMYRKGIIKVIDEGLNFAVKEEASDTSIDFSLLASDDLDDDDIDDDDGDDFGLKEPEDVKIPIKDIKKEKMKTKPVSKAKPKSQARPKSRKKQDTEEPQPSEQKKKRGSVRKMFHLRPEDYRQEGDVYICAHCDKRYDKIFSLRFHLKSQHYKIPKFTCQICSEQFMTLARFTAHKLEEHNLDERFKCNACKGAFNTKVQLRKHTNNFHMLGEKHKCDLCLYESFSYEGMYKHKFKHKTVKDFHCRFCRKSFLRKTTLDLHERIHTGDRRKVCKVCGQAFVQKASLNYHMAKYHPEVNF